MQNADTIAAIATAPGVGGVGIIRVSGPGVASVASRVIRKIPEDRIATFANFRNQSGDRLDSGLALFFKGPNSFTGEDVLELHAHGGPAVLRTVLRACFEAGARPAEPGEFSKRAFLNDKLDLAQAEAVADLIEATTETAVISAQRSLSGDFSSVIGLIKAELITIRVSIEATIDFSDEDITAADVEAIKDRLAGVVHQLETVLISAKTGALLREGIRVVIAGQPNVGKSSLMNRLFEEEVSIVTDIPGTTRDVLQKELSIDGFPIHLVDTAGLRDTADPVELIGVERAISNAKTADLILEVRATGEEEHTNTPMLEGISDRRIIVINKIDLVEGGPSVSQGKTGPVVRLSAKTGCGLDLLKQTILSLSGAKTEGETPFMARERHIRALELALSCMTSAQSNLETIEFCAEDLRQAQDAISQITGEFVSDDLLGEIFSSFCIGK
ncbi:MAG: tRNA uridine-5-carboxymethylaminomethyl(34) synthesis GTPase MnmE [Betaproteobacteria bacterium]